MTFTTTGQLSLAWAHAFSGKPQGNIFPLKKRKTLLPVNVFAAAKNINGFGTLWIERGF